MREKLRKPGIAAFYAAFLLILFVDYVSATGIHVIYSGRMFQLAIILLMGKVLVTKYSKKEYIILVFSLVIGALSFYYVHNYFAWMLFLLIFAGKDIPFKKIVSVYLLFMGAYILVTIGAAGFGIYGEISMTQDFRAMSVMETRYCFGFKHPNACHIIILQFALTLLWYFWEKIKWFHILAVALMNGILFAFTDSRTNALFGTGVLGIMLLGKLWVGLQKAIWVYGFGIITLAASLMLSLMTVIKGTESALLSFVDKIWSGRIYWGHIRANYYTIYEDNVATGYAEREIVTLFSHMDRQISIDMGFIKLYYNYGIIIFVIVIALILIKLYRNACKKDFAELLLIIIGIVWMLGETFSSGEFITRNILFIFMLDLLQKQGFHGESADSVMGTLTVEET